MHFWERFILYYGFACFHTHISTRLGLAPGKPSFLETFLTRKSDFIGCFVRIQFKVSLYLTSEQFKIRLKHYVNTIRQFLPHLQQQSFI